MVKLWVWQKLEGDSCGREATKAQRFGTRRGTQSTIPQTKILSWIELFQGDSVKSRKIVLLTTTNLGKVIP